MFKKMDMKKEKTNSVHFEDMGDISAYWNKIDMYVKEKKDSVSAGTYSYLLDINEFLAKYCKEELCAGKIKAISFMCNVLDFLKEYNMEYSSDYVLPHKEDPVSGEIKPASDAVLRDMAAFKEEMHEQNLGIYDFYKWNDNYNYFYTGARFKCKAQTGTDLQTIKVRPMEKHVVRKAVSEERELKHSWYLSHVDLPYKLRFALAAILYEGGDKEYTGEILSDIRELAAYITEGKYIWNGEVIDIDKINNIFMPAVMNKEHNETALKRLMKGISGDMSVYCAYARHMYTGLDKEWFLQTCIMNERLVRGAKPGIDGLKAKTPEELRSIFTREVSEFFSEVKTQSEMLLEKVKEDFDEREEMFFVNGEIPCVKLDHIPVLNSCSMSIQDDAFIIKSDNPLFAWFYGFLFPFKRKNTISFPETTVIKN